MTRGEDSAPGAGRERLRLRPGRPEDAARLTEIARAAKRHWGYPAAWLAAWRRELTLRPELIRALEVRVAEIGGEPAGFVAARAGASRWEIEHLWVAPRRMGHGAGRALVEELAGRARAAGAGALDVDSDPHAEGFYLRCGFVRSGSTPAPAAGAPERVLPRLTLELRGETGAARPGGLELTLLADPLAVCGLPGEAAVPDWALAALERDRAFASVTRTSSELSVVVREALVPAGVTATRGWRALEVAGPLDFSLVGVLAGLSGVLAAAGVSLFTVSTHDTDWLLVREGALDAAAGALRAAGHTVRR